MTGRLRLVGDDADLASADGVHDRRLADVRPAEEGDEPGPELRHVHIRTTRDADVMLMGMTARAINGTDELKGLIGEHLGYSPYTQVTQDQVNKFAEATGDHQWIHVDVEKANAGPFGGPIAHGYLTLALGPYCIRKWFRSPASRWASTTAPTRSASRRR